jgi:hypothetical protein
MECGLPPKKSGDLGHDLQVKNAALLVKWFLKLLTGGRGSSKLY